MDKPSLFAERKRFSHMDTSHAVPVAFRARKQALIRLIYWYRHSLIVQWAIRTVAASKPQDHSFVWQLLYRVHFLSYYPLSILWKFLIQSMNYICFSGGKAKEFNWKIRSAMVLRQFTFIWSGLASRKAVSHTDEAGTAQWSTLPSPAAKFPSRLMV